MGTVYGPAVMIEDCDSDTVTQGKTVKLQAIRRLCNKLFMIMLNC